VTIHPSALLTIALMALVTYACRAGGYWLMGRVSMSRRVEIGLTYLPGAVLISLVAPAMAEEGIPGVVAVAATAITMRRTNNLLLAMLAGIGTVWLLRQLV
jgi:uncharacterized membrane protein